jgi:hypothetical protein
MKGAGMRGKLGSLLAAGLVLAAGPVGADSSGWTDLGTDLGLPAESLSVLEGTLRYSGEDPLPAYVMRHNPYRLEVDRDCLRGVPGLAGTEPPEPPLGPETTALDIHTSADDTLRPWIGREIEIRGMIVTTMVEGHLFVEIWPAAFRPAPEDG